MILHATTGTWQAYLPKAVLRELTTLPLPDPLHPNLSRLPLNRLSIVHQEGVVPNPMSIPSLALLLSITVLGLSFFARTHLTLRSFVIPRLPVAL